MCIKNNNNNTTTIVITISPSCDFTTSAKDVIIPGDDVTGTVQFEQSFDTTVGSSR